jgi:hypothetical protein
VAVAAIESVACDVALVTELDRLLAGDPRLRDPRRAVHFIEEPQQTGDHEHRTKDADA